MDAQSETQRKPVWALAEMDDAIVIAGRAFRVLEVWKNDPAENAQLFLVTVVDPRDPYTRTTAVWTFHRNELVDVLVWREDP